MCLDVSLGCEGVLAEVSVILHGSEWCPVAKHCEEGLAQRDTRKTECSQRSLLLTRVVVPVARNKDLL